MSMKEYLDEANRVHEQQSTMWRSKVKTLQKERGKLQSELTACREAMAAYKPCNEAYERENKRLRTALDEKRPTNKCISSHCDNFIDHDYCERCRKDWES